MEGFQRLKVKMQWREIEKNTEPTKSKTQLYVTSLLRLIFSFLNKRCTRSVELMMISCLAVCSTMLANVALSSYFGANVVVSGYFFVGFNSDWGLPHSCCVLRLWKWRNHTHHSLNLEDILYMTCMYLVYTTYHWSVGGAFRRVNYSSVLPNQAASSFKCICTSSPLAAINSRMWGSWCCKMP